MTSTMPTNDLTEAMRLALLRADPKLSRFDPAAAHHQSRLLFHAAIAAGRSSSATTRTISTRCCPATLSTRAQCSRRCRIGIPARMAAWDRPTRSRSRRARARARRTSPSSATPSASAERSGSRSISPSSRRRRNSSSARPTCARSASCSTCRAGDQDDGGERVMPHLRFLNALDGQHVQKWQFKRRTHRAEADRQHRQDPQPLSSGAGRLGGPARTARSGSATTRSRPR